MSVILRCTNDNGVVQDIQVQDQIDLRLDISAIENATIGDVYGISSQEFGLVGSNEVNAFFGNVWNLGSTPAIALQNSIDCQVLLNGAEVFKGKLYIKNIITDSEGYNSIYNVIVVNETVDFKFEIQDLYLNQLNLSKFNHDLTYTNISQSWGGGLFTGSIIYPFVNYGKPEADPDAPDYAFAAGITAGTNTIDNEDSPLRLIDFKPAIRAKDVVDAIFSGSSYDYTSSFFNTDYFNNLYVLATANDQLGPNNVSPVSQSAWAYNESGSQTVSANTIVQVDFDAEIIDNANNFSLVTDRYTADTTGNYQYQINVNYTIGNYAPSTTDRVGIQLRKNGSTIVDSQFYFNPAATGSAFLQGGVSLVPSDYLEVEMSYTTTSGTRFLNILNEIGKPSYLPAGYQTYFQIKGPASLIGGNVEMSEQFPDDLKALDFLQGLIEKFNLVVEPVPNSRNLIRIEPYQAWINAGKQVDWTNKVDRDTKYEIVHPITEQPRTILFSDEEDTDILNEYTINNLGKTFGSYTFVSDSDLAEGTRRIGKTFAATPVTGVPNGRTFVVPHLCSVTDNREFRPIKFKPRLLYNNGLQTVPQSALGISGGTSTRGTIYIRDENSTVQSTTVWNQMNTLISIPANYDQGQDLHFNNDQYSQYFQASANGKVKADAYRTYWATYINSLYDIDARKLTCNVYIKPSEIQNIALNDKIFIDGHYYRINKINGANLTRRDTVEVELIKIIAQELKFPKRRVGTVDIALDYGSLTIAGTGRYINVDTGDFVDEFDVVRQVASKDYMQLYNNAGTASVVWDYQVPVDTTAQFDQTILGTNKIDVGASKVNTLGNNNEVKVGSETSLVVGSQNFVGENTTNVTTIGEGHSVEELVNNAQIIGGVSNSISSSNYLVIVGGTGSYAVNTDYSAIINGYNSGLVDSDVTTLITPHENEVVINGSGHTVIGLNLEGAGLDLLNTRANSNWMGDTYFGEAIFRSQYQLECGDSYFISLTGSDAGQGRHENLYVLNWSGLSPGSTTIELPNANNNDYETIVYQFVSNDTFDGTTEVNFVGFSGQTINTFSSYSLSNPFESITFTTYDGDWITLGDTGGQAPYGYYGNFYSSASQALVSANVSQSVTLNGTFEANGVYIASGSRIYFDNPGVYQFNWVAQLANSDNAVHDAVFWVKYNGVDYPNSNTYLSMPARKSSGESSYQLMSATFTGTAQNPNDYIELYWTGDSTNLSLFATGSNQIDGEPATPSVIANIIPIGTRAAISSSISVSASYATSASQAECANRVTSYNSDQPEQGDVYYSTFVIGTGSSCDYLFTSDLFAPYFVPEDNTIYVPDSITMSGSFEGNFTGSLLGTASYATQALSSSYALTASYALNGGGGGVSNAIIDGPVTASVLNSPLNYFSIVSGSDILALIASNNSSSTSLGNTFFGSRAGNLITTNTASSVAGKENTVIGSLALSTVSGLNSTSTTAIGARALLSTTSSLNTVAIGRNSGNGSNVSNNDTFIGTSVLSGIDDSRFNVVVGSAAGINASYVSKNVVIGYDAGDVTNAGLIGGETISGSVLIGYQAGYNETGSNVLHITNYSSSRTGSLIFGEFSDTPASQSITFNADTQVTYNLILPFISSSLNFANDAAAAAGGVVLGGVYRNGNNLQIRIS